MNHKDYIKAMTTGRWPPKPEDEMTMSPGTERAIMKAADLMTPLIKGLESVSSKLETAIKAMEKELKTEPGEVALIIALTPEEWCEVINAVDVRAMQIREDENPNGDLNKEELEVWSEQLVSAYNKMAKILDANHITY